MTIYETKEYRGFNINIHYDEDPMNPREDCDPLGTMICFHSQYVLGDRNQGLAVEDLQDEHFMRDNDIAIMLPLYLYDHSGLTMNTTGFSCPWDSGQVGVIFITNETIRREYSVKRISKKLLERITSYLAGEVETYDQYLRGDVYGFTVEPLDSNKSIECDDSCWGFFGYDYAMKEMVDQAKGAIDYAIKDYKEKACKQVNERRSREREMSSFMACAWAY